MAGSDRGRTCRTGRRRAAGASPTVQGGSGAAGPWPGRRLSSLRPRNGKALGSRRGGQTFGGAPGPVGGGGDRGRAGRQGGTGGEQIADVGGDVDGGRGVVLGPGHGSR